MVPHCGNTRRQHPSELRSFLGTLGLAMTGGAFALDRPSALTSSGATTKFCHPKYAALGACNRPDGYTMLRAIHIEAATAWNEKRSRITWTSFRFTRFESDRQG